MFGLGLAFLDKRHAGSAVRYAVAIENGEVHQRVVENVSDDRRERLPAVDMRKAPVTRREGVNKTTRPTVGRILVMEASCLKGFGCFRRTAVPEMDFPRVRNDKLAG